MSIEVVITQGHHPPANADGITVVIDVIRAFTTATHAFRNQVARIFPVATARDAFQLKAALPDALLAGEINALPIEGFDFGNSPWEISRAPLNGRDLIMRTTNGIVATLNAQNSQQVLVAGLVNAQKTVNYLLTQQPPKVVLVASHPTGDEDVACAEYMCGLLGGKGISLDEAIHRTKTAHAAQKFLNGSNPHLHAQDIHMAATSLGDQGLVLAVTFEPRPCILPLGEPDPE